MSFSLIRSINKLNLNYKLINNFSSKTKTRSIFEIRKYSTSSSGSPVIILFLEIINIYIYIFFF